MDEHTDVFDLTLSPTCIVRFDVDHAQQQIKLRLYECPVLDKRTKKLGPLELTHERHFHSRRSRRLARLLRELKVVEEKA